jgi:hypothetical protein
MNGLDDGVRRRRQKTVDLMRSWQRLRFRASVALEFDPDAREADQRPIIIDCEPDHILFLGLWIRLRRVFGEAIERHEATAFRLQPVAPGGEEVLRMLVTGGPPVRGGGGMPQRIRTSSRSVPALRTTGAG